MRLRKSEGNLRRELDMVCLRAAKLLLHRLPLQSCRGLEYRARQNSDPVETKRRLFERYFVFLLRVLQHCMHIPSAEISSEGREPFDTDKVRRIALCLMVSMLLSFK